MQPSVCSSEARVWLNTWGLPGPALKSTATNLGQSPQES